MVATRAIGRHFATLSSMRGGSNAENAPAASDRLHRSRTYDGVLLEMKARSHTVGTESFMPDRAENVFYSHDIALRRHDDGPSRPTHVTIRHTHVYRMRSVRSASVSHLEPRLGEVFLLGGEAELFCEFRVERRNGGCRAVIGLGGFVEAVGR